MFTIDSMSINKIANHARLLERQYGLPRYHAIGAAYADAIRLAQATNKILGWKSL